MEGQEPETVSSQRQEVGHPPISAVTLRNQIANRLSAPSIALAIYFGVGGLFCLFGTGVTLVSSLAGAESDPGGMLLATGLYGSALLVQSVGLYGAISMRRMRSYRWSVTAIVLALLPCMGIVYPLGLAFGVWAATIVFGRAAPYAFKNEPPPPGITGESSGSRGGLMIGLAVAGALLIPVLGVLAALAIYGVRRYVYTAKKAEATVHVSALARGIAACADSRGGQLPESSPAVPADLAAVRGTKYQSAPGDWSSDAFACAAFAPATPQYYQYRWVALSPNDGYAAAAGDLDGDGNPSLFKLRVACSEGQCQVAAMQEEQDPME